MKLISLLAATGILFMTAASQAETRAFQFNGEVQSDSLTSTAFGLALKPGQVAMLDMPGNFKLQVATPRRDDENAVAVVRLLRPIQNSNRFEIMHEAKTVGSSSRERSISYLVCGEQVTFITPAPMVTPKCAVRI